MKQAVGANHVRTQGFTIVELLIVIVVIAVLAAIVIVAYSGVRDRALDSSIQSTTSSMAKKLAVYAAANNDTFPTYMQFLYSAGLTDASSSDYRYTQTGGGTGYALTVTKGTKSYNVSNVNTTPTQGRASQHAQTTITNLVLNPSGETNSTGYGAYGATGAATRQTTPTLPTVLYGTYSPAAAFISTGAGGVYYGSTAATRPDVTAGQTYTVSYYGRVNLSSPATFSPYINWLNSGGTSVGTTNGESITLNDSEWKRGVISGVAPAGAVKMVIYFGTNDAVWTSGGRQAVDGLMVTQGAEVYPYTDPNLNTGWSWTGTANASTSTGLSL